MPFRMQSINCYFINNQKEAQRFVIVMFMQYISFISKRTLVRKYIFKWVFTSGFHDIYALLHKETFHAHYFMNIP